MAAADVMAFRVVTVSPEDPVQLAIARMLEENVGSVAVCEGERLVGIFTERDVLRLAGEGRDFPEVRVGDVMTRQPVTLAPNDDVLDAARLMGERKIRHLPVLEGENLLGMVGIREVVRALVERLWRTHDAEARDRARELLTRDASEMKSGSLREP
jgi:CBS domain-containing protein